MKATRLRLAELLRLEGSQTVEGLGAALHLTRTAVINHLAGLQADGLVRRRGLRPGTGRPSIVYELTPAAERLFPKSYDDFAAALLEELATRPGDLRQVLRRTADRWIARDLPHLQGLHGRPRFERARETLAERGFMPALEHVPGGYLVREHNCPLMRLTAAHPEVCDMVHRWLEALFGARLSREGCLREGDLFSTYRIAFNGPSGGRPSVARDGKTRATPLPRTQKATSRARGRSRRTPRGSGTAPRAQRRGLPPGQS